MNDRPPTFSLSYYVLAVSGLVWFLAVLAMAKGWSGEYLKRTQAEIRIEQLERELKDARHRLAIEPSQP